MTAFFFYSGILFWIILTPIVFILAVFVMMYWWNKILKPSVSNLLFACFGITYFTCFSEFDMTGGKSCYELWRGITGWQYRYFTRGDGQRHFGRLAMKRLVYEARKESRKNKFH